MLREQKPFFLSVDFGVIGCSQPHAPCPRPTPPYQNRGRYTDDNGNAMLLISFSEILQEDIVRRYPCAAPVVKTERKDNFVSYFLCSSAQMYFYHTPGLHQPHITVVFYTL